MQRKQPEYAPEEKYLRKSFDKLFRVSDDIREEAERLLSYFFRGYRFEMGEGYIEHHKIGPADEFKTFVFPEKALLEIKKEAKRGYRKFGIYEEQWNGLMVYPVDQDEGIGSKQNQLFMQRLKSFNIDFQVLSESNPYFDPNDKERIIIPLDQEDIIQKMRSLAQSSYEPRKDWMKLMIDTNYYFDGFYNWDHEWNSPKDIDGNLLDKELTAERAVGHIELWEKYLKDIINDFKDEIKELGAGKILEEKLRQKERDINDKGPSKR